MQMLLLLALDAISQEVNVTFFLNRHKYCVIKGITDKFCITDILIIYFQVRDLKTSGKSFFMEEIVPYKYQMKDLTLLDGTIQMSGSQARHTQQKQHLLMGKT